MLWNSILRPFSAGALARNYSSANRFAAKYASKPKEKTHHKGNRQPNQHHNQAPRSKPKPLKFEFKTGSDLAQSAVKSIIDKVFALNNGKYHVKFVDPTTNKLEKIHLAHIVNSLDLSQEGIFIIPKKDEDIPLIRKNKLIDMMKSYRDEIASAKELELLQAGSKAASKSQQQRERSEKKKSSTKVITISWDINFSDFHNQKMKEIQKKIDKRESFVIFIGDKYNLYSARMNADKSDGLIKKMQSVAEEISLEQDNSHEDQEEKENDIALFESKNLDLITKAKREKLINELKDFLATSVGKLEVSGTLDRRISLTCSNFKVSSTENSNYNKVSSELSAKEQRRLKRQQQQETKKLKNVDEDELDLLYELKL